MDTTKLACFLHTVGMPVEIRSRMMARLLSQQSLESIGHSSGEYSIPFSIVVDIPWACLKHTHNYRRVKAGED